VDSGMSKLSKQNCRYKDKKVSHFELPPELEL
jgi:hypothetical protein